MAIEPISGRGQNRARCRCDGCDRVEVIPCDYDQSGSAGPAVPNTGQAMKKMQGKGWALIKGSLLCPACVAARKARAVTPKPKEELVEKTVQAAPREASREIKRQINELLQGVYDTGRGRYQAGETDCTVANAVGGGCLPAWVASVREDFYGPNGANDDIALLSEELTATLQDVDRALADLKNLHTHVEARLSAMGDFRASIAGYDKRLMAIAKAVGPKAGVR